MLTLTMFTVEGQPIDLSQGFLNNTTGSFNLSFTAPTITPSNAYDAVLGMDFDTMAPVGGPYYRFVDAAVPPATPILPSTLIGIESEFVIEPERGALIVEMNQSVDFVA